MRSDDGGRSAGSGSGTDEWDAGSTGDPFAALNKFAAIVPLSKTDPIEDKYAATINDLENFFDGWDKVGDSVQDSFASIFEAGLRRQPNDRMHLDIMEKYPRPQNVLHINVPKTNGCVYDCVWEAMKRGPQIVDAELQKVQTLMWKSFVPLIGMIDTIGKDGVPDKPLSEYLTNTDIVPLSSAAFSLLSQTRKDIIRNDMSYPISKLCNWKCKVGVENLFEDDLMKKQKELKEQNMHFKPHKPSASRFGSRGDRDVSESENLIGPRIKTGDYDVNTSGCMIDANLTESDSPSGSHAHHHLPPCEPDLWNPPDNFKGGKLSDNYDQ